MNHFVMNNGKNIPSIGFGTFKVSNDEVTALVLKAFEAGYRHIDTAYYYQNEKGIGKAIGQSGLRREEIFITSKIWMEDMGKESTGIAFEKTMENLGLDYIDMYLHHWPRPSHIKSWKVLEKLYKNQRIKTLGVCNYNQNHLEELLAEAEIKPAINQIELHPKLQQEELTRYCSEQDILIEAWSPIMKGQVMEMELLKEIGQKYGKSPAQVTLKWHLCNKRIVIPKTVTEKRMIENRNLNDFDLTHEELMLIKSLDDGIRVGADPDDIYRNGYNP